MTAIRARRTMGAKVTGAAPKPAEYGYRCWLRKPDGTFICGTDPDGQRPKLIAGLSSDEAVLAAQQRHLAQQHPTPQQLAASGYRRQPYRRRPVRSTSGI